MSKMTEDELLNACITQIDNAIGYLETETVAQRAEAMDYYLRKPYGNEVEGSSQVVTGEVAEAVDGALPQLIRVFTSNEDAVQFEPVKDGDEPFAEQASDMANWVFYKDNDGFLILHNWFKDALLQKVGIVKAYWEEKKDVTKEKYENLSDDEMTMLLMDGEFEIVKQKTDAIIGADGMVYNSHSVTIQRTKDKSRIVIENVPPEEFLISKTSNSIEGADFVAHRRMISRGDLIAMGFEQSVVDEIPAGDRLEYSPERLARYQRDELPDYALTDDVEVFECFIKADMIGKGIPELRKVLIAGNKILSNDDCDYVPFHSICPIPIPHLFFGQSMADRTMDIQLEKSTILRQMFNNLYLTNNYRVAAVEGQVNLDDLLTSTAGGVVRVKNPNAIIPLTVQSTANQSFPMFEYLDGALAKRTGVSDMQQGLDPNVLQNVSATAVAAMTQQSQGKLELIARIFAETGVKSLFRGILHLLCKYQEKERTLRLRGKWVTFDPREWDTEYDVSINVGLGNGNRQEQIAMLQMIMAKQEEIIGKYGANNPLVTVSQYRSTLGRMIEMAGFKDTTAFINEITPEVEQQIMQQASQPPQDPTAEAAKLYADIERSKAELKAQSDAAKNELDRQKMGLEAERKNLELAQRSAKDAADNRIAEAKLALQGLELQLKQEVSSQEAQSSQLDAVMKAIGSLQEIARG
jgi:hypothetical protein